MASRWTDEDAILRDLSFGQGRWVPGAIGTAIAGEKPRTPIIDEETEEEYFQRWTTDADFSTGPDLSSIKQMLEMVKVEEPEESDPQSGSIEITKLNPDSFVFIPTSKKIKSAQQGTDKMVIKKKPRRERNVAIASLIARSEQVTNAPEVPIKLAKPEDFIKTVEPTVCKKVDVAGSNRRKNSVKKVNNWLHYQDFTTMFKKKSSMNSVNEDDKSLALSPEGSVKSPNRVGEYTPSSWANECYKKYVDRNHMQELIKENIWDRAEVIMKSIDERKAEELRKQQEEADAATLAAADIETVKTDDNEDIAENLEKAEKEDDLDVKGIAKVLLPQHRHLLTGECVVCQVLTKGNPREHLEEPKTVAKVITGECEEDKSDDKQSEKHFKGNADTNVNKDKQLYTLVRSTLIDNLTELEAKEFDYIHQSKSSSLEELNFTFA